MSRWNLCNVYYFHTSRCVPFIHGVKHFFHSLTLCMQWGYSISKDVFLLETKDPKKKGICNDDRFFSWYSLGLRSFQTHHIGYFVLARPAWKPILFFLFSNVKYLIGISQKLWTWCMSKNGPWNQDMWWQTRCEKNIAF